MSESLIQKLKDNSDYLSVWLTRLRDLVNNAPKVQQMKDYTDWAMSTQSNLPEEAREIPSFILEGAVDVQSQFIQDSLPKLPRFDANVFSSSSAANTTMTTVFYGFVNQVGDIPTDNAREYARFHSAAYAKLHETYAIVDQIRSILSRVNDSMALSRLDTAFTTFTKWKSGLARKTATANEIRNLLYGFKGDLFGLAYGKTKANKKWDDMCPKIAKGGADSLECRELLKQGKTHTELLSRLADVLKEREGGSLTDLNVIWTEVLDHIYVTLNYTLLAN